MALKNPILSNPIAVDIPKLNEILDALSKANPTDVDGISTGAMRLYEVSSGRWQWQEYNGSSWAAVPFLQHNVDQLDGYHAAITPAANTVAVRNASGLLQDSITGNAATASSAATLSQTLPVNKGGTGATTSEQARTNLGVPPTSHASTATMYGAGNATQYGHLKLSDATDSASGVSGGVAATPAAAKAAKDAADAAQSSADAAMTKASTLAAPSTPGIVKPGTGMTVDAAGALNVNTASTSMAGIVQLNNTITSTSTTQAATANAVKTAYDKAEEAASKGGLPLGHIFAWPFPTAPDGCIILNGSTYNRSLYVDFFGYIKSKGWTKTETEWQSIAQANNGFCPWYSEGDGSTNFRTPKFAPYQKLALASDDAGKYYEAGLPTLDNISFTTDYILSNDPWRILSSQNNRAYNVDSVSSLVSNVIEFTSDNVSYSKIKIKRDTYSEIYGSSDTVTPESHDWIICAVAFGSATNVGSVDVANVMSAVGQVQANPNLQGTAHLVETWKSSDGSSWYRKWSDGFIEQGCVLTTSNISVSFPVAFSNTNYTVTVAPVTGDYMGGTHSIAVVYGWSWFGLSHKTTTGVGRGGDINVYDRDLYIYACGY